MVRWRIEKSHQHICAVCVDIRRYTMTFVFWLKQVPVGDRERTFVCGTEERNTRAVSDIGDVPVLFSIIIGILAAEAAPKYVQEH